MNPDDSTIFPSKLRTLRGDEARGLLETQIAEHNGGLLSTLAKYRADTVRVWHDTIRAIEEFINVPFFGLDDDALVAWLMAVPLDGRFFRNPTLVTSVQAALRPHLEGGTVERFCRLMLQIAAISAGFRMNGQASFGAGITLDTIGDAMIYLQSRRRHFVSLLYLMPLACRGDVKLAPLDALNVLLPQVEHSCVTITSLHLKLMLLDALPEFTLQVDEQGALASHWLETLDPWFADPERASIVVMNELRGDQIAMHSSEPVDPTKIFSAAELRNSIKLLVRPTKRSGSMTLTSKPWQLLSSACRIGVATTTSSRSESQNCGPCCGNRGNAIPAIGSVFSSTGPQQNTPSIRTRSSHS